MLLWTFCDVLYVAIKRVRRVRRMRIDWVTIEIDLGERRFENVYLIAVGDGLVILMYGPE